MQIVMMATGTRGDVQPVIALGKALKENGHQVRLIAGSNFSEWIESHGLDVYPTVDIAELMRSELGIQWIQEENQYKQLQIMKAMTHTVIEETVRDTIAGTEGADFLIAGFLAQPYVQAISEKHNIPMITAALQPFRPTNSGAASLVPVLARRNSFLNRWMGYFAEYLTWTVAEKTTNALRDRLGLAPFTARDYSRATSSVPVLYGFSPQIVPPTDDTHSITTGYWFLDEPYTPPDNLVQFLDAGDPPIYFGFGSMPDANPSETLDMISTVLKRLNRQGIVIQGWSDIATDHNSDQLFVLKGASHTWLFPKVAAVVHHGGAGTTAAALRAGQVNVIIPHLADQPYWARRLYELGLSPKSINRHKVTADSLVKALDTALSDPMIQSNVSKMGDLIQKEDGVADAVNWIEDYIAKHVSR